MIRPIGRFFWFEGYTSWLFLIAVTTGLFLRKGFVVLTAQFDFRVLLTDSFVHLDASTTLEKEGNGRFPKELDIHRSCSEGTH